VRAQNLYHRFADFATVPTIPGKFETVLYKGNQEEKGFGSQTPRFGQEPRPAAPGPGAYSCRGLAVVSQAGAVAGACVGKRGNGAFASRRARFRAVPERKPGPGTYEATEAAHGVPKSIKKAPNAAFVRPKSMNPSRFRERVSPGPCDYADKLAETTWGKGAVTIPRDGASGDQRCDFGIKDVPGPGHYDDEYSKPRPASVTPLPERAGKRQLVSTSDPEPPDRLRKASSLLRTGQPDRLMEEVASGAAGAVQSARGTPGPGSYEPQISASKGPSDFSQGESRAFRVGNSHVPRRWEESSPGPCDYDSFKETLASGKSAKTDLTAAAFASVTDRFKDSKPTAPGPAYYSPRSTRKLNQFHLNISRHWM